MMLNDSINLFSGQRILLTNFINTCFISFIVVIANINCVLFGFPVVATPGGGRVHDAKAHEVLGVVLAVLQQRSQL